VTPARAAAKETTAKQVSLIISLLSGKMRPRPHPEVFSGGPLGTGRERANLPEGCLPYFILSVVRLPRGGGGSQKSFIRGGSAPRSNPLPFYIPFFSEKVPLSYIFYWKKASLLYTFLRRIINKSLKQEVFLTFFHVARNK